MTVIRPNSISGITSITAQANEINVFRSNGLIAGLNLNGVNFNTTSGISTLAALKVTGNVDVAGVLTYQDVTNVDSLGIGTFRVGVNVPAGQLDVGSNIKLGNAGVITATSFSGSGANLTGIPAQATIANNGNDRIITGGSGVNLNGEANLQFDGTDLYVSDKIKHLGDPDTLIEFATDTITFDTAGAEALRITSGGDISIGGRDEALNNYAAGSTTTKLAVVKNGAGSGYHEIAHFTGGTDSNDTGAIVRITQFNNDRGLYIKGGRGTGDVAKAIFGLRNSGAADSDVMTFIQGGNIGVGVANPTAKLHTSAAYNEIGAIITAGALGYTDPLQVNTANGHRRFTVAGDGEIYGPSGGRKNWFDNGSFDCTYGGRKANVSMDYGNHHAYGWVTDRFMSRNSVQWSRSSNVPTGKGFSYSTYTNGAGGILMQAVELPDYGDMGVFTPSSYWCVSFWSTATCNPSGAAFSYDLGNTKTDITDVAGGAYASTGETATGTSTGTFTRYYKVFQMPSSIISTATAAYWQWGFSQQGYATGWQLEKVPTSTSKPTPYEHVHPSVTINRCRRYAYRKYNSRHVCGWKRHDSGVNWDARHPVLPTHMPSGSNQSADPYGVHMHTAGILTNFQSIWQNPAVTGLYRYGFNPADGSFVLYGTSSYSGTHIVVPSWEGFEYEIQHGFF